MDLSIIKLIGQGEYGKVYKAKNKNGRIVVIKNSGSNLRSERNIAKILSAFNVPAVYGYRELLISEFIDGVTFDEYINARGKDTRALVHKVITNLEKIHKKIPTFRHHDLHLHNVMVMKGKDVKLMDFGLATLQGVNNPNIKTFKQNWGVFPESHHMYDAHLFLNSLYGKGVMRRAIESLLPKEYLTENSDRVKNFRLRSDVNHDEFLEKFTYKNILTATSVINSITSGKKPPPSVKPKTPINKNKAKKNALAFLTAQKKTSTTLKKPGIAKSKNRLTVTSITPANKKPGLTRSKNLPLTRNNVGK